MVEGVDGFIRVEIKSHNALRRVRFSPRHTVSDIPPNSVPRVETRRLVCTANARLSGNQGEPKVSTDRRYLVVLVKPQQQDLSAVWWEIHIGRVMSTVYLHVIRFES